ncbi:HNH endonuclease [Kribbella jiaozuonensis]|uniref:HNH endonuclease n=1 Tax=Kribbella jiaozuonensis TaxID=2575441 RepID=UPI001F315586|nr:HNH endonuclease [Kribbella jiaozuonensis]
MKRGLIVPPDRLQSACKPCNNKIGDPRSKRITKNQGQFSPGSAPGHPALSVRSLPGTEKPVEARAELLWSPGRLEGYSWLRGLLEVPEDASPPLYMSLPPDDAVGSYGQQAIDWIESTQTDPTGRHIKLRWWQKLGITRQLEHREDGSLCHRVVLESCPRRAGKSVRLRGLALWRMAHPTLFGEVQTVIHIGSDLKVCREIQRGAWPWAEKVAGWTVARGNGKEQIETPDGDRWIVSAQEAAGYSFDVTFGIVDEAWNVKPDAVSEGLEPATLERLSPQLHLTSTAHRKATSLMKTHLRDAITSEDTETLLLLWGATAGQDPSAIETWKAASPHWSEDRRKMIADKYSKALAGEADPAADDPDPMQGFLAQYLNIWQLTGASAGRGEPIVKPNEWASLVEDTPKRVPDAAAIEDWFGQGVSLALAWRLEEEVVVSVKDFDDLTNAVDALKATKFRRTATVGASLLEDPALKGVQVKKGSGRVGASVQELGRLLSEYVVLHDGGEHLTGQVVGARTVPGADGPRMVSHGRADAIKTAVWAVTDCRKKSLGKPRIIVAA